MSFKISITTVVKVARVTIVALVLGALFVAGSTAAKRSFAESQEQPLKKIVAVASVTTDLALAPAAEGANGNMAKGSRPTTEQSCVLQAVTIQTNNDDLGSRLRIGSSSEIATLTVNSDLRGHRGDKASLAGAAPQVARTHTLVGAIPSGTM
jgi:hypothetical protein